MKIMAPFHIEVTRDYFLHGKRHLVWLLFSIRGRFYRVPWPNRDVIVYARRIER